MGCVLLAPACIVEFFVTTTRETTSPAAGLAQPSRAHVRQVPESGARLAHLHKHLPHELRIARDVQVVRGLGEPGAKRVHAGDVLVLKHGHVWVQKERACVLRVLQKKNCDRRSGADWHTHRLTKKKKSWPGELEISLSLRGGAHRGCDADTSSCEPLRERDLFLFCCRFTGHSCLVVNRRPPRARALPRPNRAGPNRPRVFTLSHTTRLFTTERKWRPIKRKKSAAGEASRRADAAGAVHRSARGVRAAAGGIRAPSGSGRNEGGGLASAPIERQQHRLQVRLPPPPPPPPRSPSFPPCVVWCARTPQRTAASPPLPSVAPPLCWPLREFPATQRLSPGLTA